MPTLGRDDIQTNALILHEVLQRQSRVLVRDVDRRIASVESRHPKRK